jgi:hypothetical protein
VKVGTECVTLTSVESFACGHCGAALTFDGVRTEICPYCASPSWIERPRAPEADPRFVLTFAGGMTSAQGALARWIGSRSWFADPALRRGRAEGLRGIYVPAYLYSAVARTEYTAQIGEHYSETRTVRVKGKDGEYRDETRTVTRTEYRALAGSHVGYVTDVLVSASRGLRDDELAQVEPYDFRQMRRFGAPLVSGWVAEEFARPVDACERACRAEALDHVSVQLRRFMPGDGHSDLNWKTRVEWESVEPVLVPVWVLALRYREDKAPLRVVINGQTGKVGGRVPLSWPRVAFALVMLAAAIVAAVLLLRGHA